MRPLGNLERHEVQTTIAKCEVRIQVYSYIDCVVHFQEFLSNGHQEMRSDLNLYTCTCSMFEMLVEVVQYHNYRYKIKK